MSYSYTSSSSDGDALAFLLSGSFILIVFAIIGIVFLACYLIQVIPLYKMAKNAGYEHPWFAFVPILNFYLTIVLPRKPFTLFNGNFRLEKRSTVFWIYLAVALGGSTIASVFSIIPFVGAIFSILISLCITAFYYIVIYKINYDLFELYDPQGSSNVLLSILCLFVPIILLVYYWIWSKKKPIFVDSY